MPVKGGAAHVQQDCNVLAALVVVDQLPGVVDLLPGKFGIAPDPKKPPRMAAAGKIARPTLIDTR